MATDTAAMSAFVSLSAPASTGNPHTQSAEESSLKLSKPPRQYWQLPIFMLGLSAAIVSWKAFPSHTSDPRSTFQTDLQALRAKVDQRPMDATSLMSAVKRVSDAIDQHPEDASFAQYLLGSAHLLVAESGTSGAASAESWKLANEHFSRCDVQKLTDKADQQRCVFRSAKAASAVGVGDARLLVSALVVVPGGEEAGERGRLLAETYLRVVPPEVRKARDELAAYVSGPNRSTPAAISRYKLKLGELCLTLNEPERARSWLTGLIASSPPDMQALASVQLGRLAAAEKNWTEAVRLFEAAQAMSGVPAADLAVIRYDTGRGWLAMNNPTAAIPHFEQAASAGGAIATAARLRLAEMAARDPALRGNRNRAAELIAQSVQGVTPTEYRNTHASLDELRAAFEEIIQVSLTESDFASAVQAANAFTPIAPAGRDRERRAEANEAWASLFDRAPDVEQAKARRIAAAEDFLAIAREQTSPAAQVEMFRRAAVCLRKAGDDRAALDSIEKLLMVPGAAAAATAAAWLEKGDILLAEKKFAEGNDALKKAIEQGGPYATVAQVKFARSHIEEGRRKIVEAGNDAKKREEARAFVELGKQVLAQISNKTYETNTERDAQQEALFELGKVYVHLARNYLEAEVRFRRLVQINPAGPYAEDAKLYLGTCLLLTARGENGRPTVDGDRKLTEALGLFQSLTESKKTTIQTQADLRVVRSLFLLRRFNEMPELCGRLCEKYHGKVEELIVLSMLYWGYKQAERPTQAEMTFARMQEVYDRLPDQAFSGILDEYTRTYWEKGHVPPLLGKQPPKNPN